MKGIILAGGTGSRLFPITVSTSKQLLPIYDKPLIYYSLSTLISMGIKEIMVITTREHKKNFIALLGDGSNFGINLSYIVQPKPEGIAQAFILCEKFIGKDSTCLILGDNIFHSNTITADLERKLEKNRGSIIFTYEVSDPERYGVVKVKNNKILSIKEKPKKTSSKDAITGLYIFDSTVSKKAKSLKPSKRGELEITDLINHYLKDNSLKILKLEKGSAWLDTGTFDSLNEASMFIHTLEKRQGIKIGCPEETSLRIGNLNKKKLKKIIFNYPCNDYKKYLLSLI